MHLPAFRSYIQNLAGHALNHVTRKVNLADRGAGTSATVFLLKPNELLSETTWSG
jgi:hypothetical protein